MPLCKEKKEDIKSSTMGIYKLLKAFKKEGKIDDQDFVQGLAWLRKIERCCNLEGTYREVINHEKPNK
jgi:hypothetical protein